MTKSSTRFSLALCSILTALALSIGSADAATGYVSGTWYFYNHNGNYCPSTNACTGAMYRQSEYNTYKRIPNASVWVTDSNGYLLGAGNTDYNGIFNVSWNSGSTPSEIQVHVWAAQKDGRFYFADSSGGRIHTYTSAFTPSTTSTSTSPQDIGNQYVGSASSPDAYFNAYWVAEKQWRTVMGYSYWLVSAFTDVEVRGFANSIPGFMGTCNTSCANGSAKRVQLDANAAYSPQARAMHELGHVASYLTHPWRLTNNYNYPSTTGNGGWSQTSAEWA